MTEQENRNELMIKLVEQYLRHVSHKTDNPYVEEIARKVVELDLLCMWMLTQ